VTENIGGYPPYSEAASTEQSTATIARTEAANVGQSAREAGASVTDTAAEQARNVVEETRRQASGLLGEARSQAQAQAQAQQRKAAQNLHQLAGQLNDMAAKSGEAGLAARLTEEASHRVHDAAVWLDRREPGDLLGEVRDFARRRPGTFLLGAALAGVLAGRMTRGVSAAMKSGDSPEPGPSWQSTGASAAAPVPAASQPAEPWPAPASGPAPAAMPAEGVGLGTEYGSDLPGTGYGDDPGADDGFSYRPGQP
jgi:hypothetical protein